jgi:hypothetical protein
MKKMISHQAYLNKTRAVMEELCLDWEEDMEELIAALPTIALEHVVNSPDGPGSRTGWDDRWLKLCQDEYIARTLLL